MPFRGQVITSLFVLREPWLMILWGVSLVPRTRHGPALQPVLRVHVARVPVFNTWGPIPGDLVSTQLETERDQPPSIPF